MLYPQINAVRQRLDLGGLWQCQPDREKVGEQAGWFNGLTETRPIAVPASWNEQYADLYNFQGILWYEYSFDLPSNWLAHQQHAFLRIGSVFYQAKVWLDGTYLGEHIGGHLPFEFEVTSQIQVGQPHHLTVMVDSSIFYEQLPPSNVDGIDGVFGPKDQFPPVGYDFFPFGGIHRPVYLYTSGSSYLTDLTITTKLGDNNGATVSYKLEFSGDDTSEWAVKVSTAETLANQHNIAITVGTTSIESNFTVTAPKLWDTQHPHLYQMQVQLYRGDELVDQYTETYGIREVRIEDDKLLLNGQPVFLKGFGKHEDFAIIGKGLNLAVIVRDFDLLRWIGANSVRTSHYPYAEEFLDYADRQGILVIDETPFVGLHDRLFQPEILQQAQGVIRELIQRDKNHPSVIAWSLANEPKAGSAAAQEFFAGMYQQARQLDATRPITYVGQGGLEDNPAFAIYDFVCINRYIGWYTHAGRLEEAAQQLKADLAEFYDAFHKPIVLTEFGADAIPGVHSDIPVLFSEEYQAEMLERYYTVLHNTSYCIGAHVWAFADFRTAQQITRVMDNRKGVFTRDRQPKLAAHMLRRLWKEKSETRD